tara:strand:- start:178 stop:312 length:135 start_codon:yes stop_codon:yes gene_type:complete
LAVTELKLLTASKDLELFPNLDLVSLDPWQVTEFPLETSLQVYL